ncbi:MAG: MATE family efflux transporter, partial [Angelakisella sp.]|nr:MATE family efflux transporter [Angelakisella sp.]
MCTGSLPKKILLFSLPLMATGVLQLIFNAADIIVVGKYVGSHALAAVGSNGPVINLIVNLFMGISIGGSAVIAQHYGAGQYEDVSEATHTSMLLGLISGFVVMVIGLLATPTILRWMATPEEVLPLAVLYLRIYFLGMPGCMLYNFGAAVLRGVGDTRRPLLFLTFAGIVNVALNLLLVIRFNLSVAGVGIATVVSQYISAGLVLWCMLHTDGCYHINPKRLALHREKLVRILKIGVPAGMQGAIFSISNVLIQSSVNSFGSTVMAGNAAASNIEGFVFTCSNS